MNIGLNFLKKRNRIISYTYNLETLKVESIKSRFSFLNFGCNSKLWSFDNPFLEAKYKLYNDAILISSMSTFVETFEIKKFEIFFPYRIHDSLYRVTQTISIKKLNQKSIINHLEYKCKYSQYRNEIIKFRVINTHYNEVIINYIFIHLFIKTSLGLDINEKTLWILYYSLTNDENKYKIINAKFDLHVSEIEKTQEDFFDILTEIKKDIALFIN